LVAALEHHLIHLLYDDLKPGGILAKAVNELSFFPDFECNNAFLELINFTYGCEPREGLCEIFVRYHLVCAAQRLEHQQQADTAVSQAGPDTSVDNMSIGANNMSICANDMSIGNGMDDNDGINLASIIVKAGSAHRGQKRNRIGKQNGLFTPA
jgi:hypothetical protein